MLSSSTLREEARKRQIVCENLKGIINRRERQLGELPEEDAQKMELRHREQEIAILERAAVMVDEANQMERMGCSREASAVRSMVTKLLHRLDLLDSAVGSFCVGC